MANTSSVYFNEAALLYSVLVNGSTVYTTSDGNRVQTISDRLNRIFADANRDLDFITFNGKRSVRSLLPKGT